MSVYVSKPHCAVTVTYGFTISKFTVDLLTPLMAWLDFKKTLLHVFNVVFLWACVRCEARNTPSSATKATYLTATDLIVGSGYF